MSAGFVVLPDTADGAAVRALLPFADAQVVPHASGRPWLVGRWPHDQVTVAAAGPARLAVIGPCPVTADRLARLAAGVSRLPDVDRVVPSLRGSCHLVASVDGRVRFQGSLSGLRRVFHTRVNGVRIAADRSDVLAAAAGSGVDEEALALRVACGLQVPYPANARSAWSGVATLAPDTCLQWDGDRDREVRWWQPPPRDRSFEEGAQGVRDALTAVLEQRPPSEGRLSADLSGGLDSTSLSFLAARRTPELLTFRWGEAEAGNDDAAYAGLAAGLLDRAEHLVVPQDELPGIFADPAVAAATEEPLSLTRATARIRRSARLLAGHGSRRHLAGHGGDELFSPLPGYLHTLMRRHPLTALRHVRAYCALTRWPLRATLAEIANPGTCTGWWREQAEELTAPRPPQRRPTLGWGLGAMRAAPWTTARGVELARAALRRAAEEARPLADDLATHTTLLVVRSNTFGYRLLAGLYAEAGVRLDMPYLDDTVLDAVLRVPAHEHAGPWRYKPLLAAAMRDIVPDAVRTRSTKGEFGEDIRRGLRRNLPAVLDVCADSELAARGLIDPAELRRRLALPQPDNTTPQALENLLGCETWLRAATGRGPTAPHDDRTPHTDGTPDRNSAPHSDGTAPRKV
ncbi:asparagine synthase [Streptomyces angustmyceticus]|uniref:asparagine synthase (glutamine-hydrolyzing) n=1 Tax=Streptomyces angustmyceticus TaxID=285578 RepID=A0A5J4LJ54_9ACTN|nr:asparagine synthase [Streptomyces angustmyceticus]